MHDPRLHQASPRLLLFAGTGEGPPLVSALLAMGWRVNLNLVSAVAGQAYAAHPDLAISIGAIGTSAAIAAVLDQAQKDGQPFTVVVDATHPFATTISADLAEVCRSRAQPLLRLRREVLRSELQVGCGVEAAASPGHLVQVLTGLDNLLDLNLRAERLLLAIGHRQLARAVALTPGAIHHARLLPHPTSLQRAMAAGLADTRVACLRPSPVLGSPASSTGVEEALLGYWGITTILARQSGGVTEACWRGLAERFSIRLLLLQRPADPDGVPAYSLGDLLTQLADRIAKLTAPSCSNR